MKTTKLEFINRTRKDEEEDDENGERKKDESLNTIQRKPQFSNMKPLKKRKT